MKKLLLAFYITFIPLSYSVDLAKSLPAHMVYYKQKGKKISEPEKPIILPEKTVSCNLKDNKIKPKGENFLKSHIESMKEFRDSINKTIEEVVNKTPTSNQIARIMVAISNLINSIDTITESNHLDKVMDVINESEDKETVSDIYEMLCEVKNFLHIFSLSFIEETVKELPIKNEFDKKIESDWYKNGSETLKKSITMLEKFIELESCRKDIMAFFPLVEKNYKQVCDQISKMVNSTSEDFLKESLGFVDSIQDFKGVLKQIETNTCLINSKGITQAQEIVLLAKGLQTYFSDLSNKLKEILEDVESNKEEKMSRNIEYDNYKSDGYIQDVVHYIFLCKHNKMFYKQMNNEVSKLLTLIKNLQEIQE